MIKTMREEGHTQKYIARTMNKDKSAVIRELCRNRDLRSGKYNEELAQRNYKQRQTEKPRAVKFTDAVKAYVTSKLAENWSPEPISKSPSPAGINMVSHERIYQYIAQDKKKGG